VGFRFAGHNALEDLITQRRGHAAGAVVVYATRRNVSPVKYELRFYILKDDDSIPDTIIGELRLLG
jgi:hypothetical protein